MQDRLRCWHPGCTRWVPKTTPRSFCQLHKPKPLPPHVKRVAVPAHFPVASSTETPMAHISLPRAPWE
jgi:hypothetical protein